MDKRTEEHKRLDENYADDKDWMFWGPYLSDRQWGTVREDYSPDGEAWQYFDHDQARSRTYRWGEDGLAGISDRYCNICFGLSLWNGKDPLLKERLYGLSGPEGNHGEDVKELYYHLENTPTHSYMKHLYKYPQSEFPYIWLRDENAKRGKDDLEFELVDTEIFEDNAYFDVYTEYAKADNNDLLIKISIANRNSKAAKIHLLPTLWSRNLWEFKEIPYKPVLKMGKSGDQEYLTIDHPYTGKYNLYFEKADRHLFTENETNNERVFNRPNDHPYKKDLFHTAVINNEYTTATEKSEGTKFAAMYERELKAGETISIKLRLSELVNENPFNTDFDTIFNTRQLECDAFYNSLTKSDIPDVRNIERQALSGLLWSKQYYNYDVETWLNGDPKEPEPPQERKNGRNSNWKTLRNHDIMLMPDTWEYPWYAAWDSAFHCVTMALVDPEFAKHQLLLFTKEWYMAPNGQIPAYEWSFSDVNPPVQAWAAMRIYNIEKEKTGKNDINFLKRIFNKLALNFTWWVNREDRTQNNVFEGGFLGMDNIGVFDRSHGIPGDAHLEQVDGTSWMALYCLNMLEISIEIALVDIAYEEMATKYFGHFVFIAEALNAISEEYIGVWDEEQGFFYDKLVYDDGGFQPIKARSIVGLLSLTAILTVKKETLEALPQFKYSVAWFKKYRMRTLKYPVVQDFEEGQDLLLSLVPKQRVEILMKALLHESEFLSEYGIRSLSKVHENPYSINIHGVSYSINYEPAESSTGMFGGNSNWRGPIWMPMNYLFIQALKQYYAYYGDEFTFEYPSESGNHKNLLDISIALSKRLIKIFEKDDNGNRPVHRLYKEQYQDEHFKDLILFYEYFHGDNGRGVGASHQTGWTALVVNLIDEITISGD
ncbi:MAG TPA: glucosidase [Leeuwenhoekiella sp.]|nr:glucosidase [Leeuwenhoekiella sp.]